MNVAGSPAIPKNAKAILLFVYAEDLKKQIVHFPISANVRKKILEATQYISAKAGAICTLPMFGAGKQVVILAGLGLRKEIRRSIIESAVRMAVQTANQIQQTHVACLLPDWGDDPVACAQLVAQNARLAQYKFVPYKKTSARFTVRRFDIVVPKADADPKIVRASIARANIIADEVNNARDLSNTPGGDMTPTLLAEHAKKTGRRAGFSVRVLDEKKMKALGMGGILGVARGSDEPAQFIIAEYYPENAVQKKPVVLIGKGVTFDTGGLNIKPEMTMADMHLDMSGGASALHALAAIARLKLPVRVVVLIPAAENMPSGSGYRPGDILQTYSGKTIEVKHTDAEGRILLADALGYAKTFSPDVVIDIATLTGASLLALGRRASAILSSDEELQNTLMTLGEATGERVWPFPLWPEFKSDIAGDFGDVANIGKTRFGGVITAGVFLWEFAPVKRWAHIDIAPTMVAIEDDRLSPGSKGVGVGLLTAFVEQYAKTHEKK